MFVPGSETLVVSAGLDKEVKLWSIDPESQEEPYTLLSSVKLPEAIEHFCFINSTMLLVANANEIAILKI